MSEAPSQDEQTTPCRVGPQRLGYRDEPMTGPQKSYLDTLARQAGEDVPETLTKAEASKLIEELQQRTGRGAG